MGQVIKVGMADLKTAKAPDSLTTIGLGSCCGVTLYDPTNKIGGLAHIMLPDSTAIKNNSNVAKFADTGIQELYNQMIKLGASRIRMVAKIAGGAKMFDVAGAATANVGERNAEASRKKLRELGIKIIAEDCGLNYGRTVTLDCNNGSYTINSVGKPLKVI